MKISNLRQLFAAFAITATMNSIAMPPMAMKTPRNAVVVPIKAVANKAVHAESAWVRAAPPGAMMLAGYMSLRNDGKNPQRFVSAQSDAFGMVELHKSVIANGVSTMRAVGDQIVPPGGTLRIAPGGLHLMLMEPKRVLKIGDTVRFRLHFADGSAIDVDAKVSAEAPTR